MTNETEIRYTPKRIASILGISEQWARALCRRIVGKRRRYRLTKEQYGRVEAEYNEYRQDPAQPIP